MMTNPNKIDVQIEYCVPCDYSDYALKVSRELLKEFQHDINSLTLITGSKGIFDIKINDELVFSKNKLNRFPDTGEVSELLKEKWFNN